MVPPSRVTGDSQNSTHLGATVHDVLPSFDTDRVVSYRVASCQTCRTTSFIALNRRRVHRQRPERRSLSPPKSSSPDADPKLSVLDNWRLQGRSRKLGRRTTHCSGSRQLCAPRRSLSFSPSSLFCRSPSLPLSSIVAVVVVIVVGGPFYYRLLWVGY